MEINHLHKRGTDESAGDPDDARNDGGDVGVGGHADVTEHVHGVEYHGVAAGQLLEDEDKEQDDEGFVRGRILEQGQSLRQRGALLAPASRG